MLLPQSQALAQVGLLYHFHDKEALLKAILDRRVKRAMGYSEKSQASQRETNQKILSDRLPGLDESHEQKKKMQGQLLAAIAQDTRLPVPYQQGFQKQHARVLQWWTETREGCRYSTGG